MIARLIFALLLPLTLTSCVSNRFERRVAVMTRFVQFYCNEVNADLRSAYHIALAKQVAPNRVRIDCANDQQVLP